MNWVFYKQSSLKLLAALPVALVVSSMQLYSLEGLIYNAQFKARRWLSLTPTTEHANIELVYIGKSSIQEFGQNRNLKPEAWLRLAEQLNAARPFAVAFVGFDSDALPSSELRQRFAQSFPSVRHVLMGSNFDEKKGRVETLPVEFSPRFEGAFQGRTHDRTSFARDLITRRAFLTIDNTPALAAKLASTVRGDFDPQKTPGVFEVAPGTGNYQYYINYQGSKDTFRSRELAHIVRGEGLESLRGKIVIVGYNDMITADDYVKTPFSSPENPVEITITEATAHATATLLENNQLIKSPDAVTTALVFVVVFITAFGALSLSPGWGLLQTLSTLILTVLVAFAAFLNGYWLLAAPILLGTVASYYVFLPFRLIAEHKRRWELQRKHNLMLEVEELKTNFMSLVSHDLKTPVARIQGLAELGLDDPQINDNPRQRQVLQGVLRSSQELLQFIGNILNLSRVESGAVALNLQMVDPNELVERSLQKFKDLAASKSITLDARLEPLFAMKCDTTLVQQVLGNLIENAIRYSPSGTTVTVSTQESVDAHGRAQVEFLVKDHGIGIESADLSRIFQKFYRGRNPNKIATKGSGLGLYLVKYFTELHGGHVDVQSEAGQGSAFTVVLPSQGPTPRHTSKDTRTFFSRVRQLFKKQDSMLVSDKEAAHHA